MYSKQTIRWAISCAFVVAIVGCGDSGPKTYPVTGTVTLNGKPIEGAAVAFSPSSADGLPASGFTDASGVYKLKTKNSDGAVAGSYSVTIAKYKTPTEDVSAEASEPAADLYDITNEYPEDYNEEQANEEASSVVSKNELPDKYADPGTSGFTADVAETDENTFDFNLE